MRRFFLTFAAVANLLLVDQVVKAASIFALKGAPPKSVVPGFFDLAYVENRGCAWGFLQGHVWPLAVFACFALALLAWKRRSVFPSGKWGAACETLLWAGILGNLVDRLSLGCVVDMFDFHWGVHHFPCFNPADVYITFAAAILLGAAFFAEQKKKPAARTEGAT